MEVGGSFTTIIFLQEMSKEIYGLQDTRMLPKNLMKLGSGLFQSFLVKRVQVAGLASTAGCF